MADHSWTLANLVLKANLLSDDYPEELKTITVFELHDIHERNPLLAISFDPSARDGLTRDQQERWHERHEWGRGIVRMEDADRMQRWLEHLAAPLLQQQMEEVAPRLDEEEAFEVLYVAECLRRSSSPYSALAARLSERVQQVLGQGAAPYSRAHIEQRLRDLIGDPKFRLENAHAH
jgi:hypothetical protein